MYTHQPDADPGAPGIEVAHIGQVGGARAVTVAEEESGEQVLIRGTDQRGSHLVWHFRRHSGGDRFQRVAIPFGSDTDRKRATFQAEGEVRRALRRASLRSAPAPDVLARTQAVPRPA